MKKYYIKCKSVTKSVKAVLLSLVCIPLIDNAETIYIDSGDFAQINITGVLSDSETVSHRIYENASSATAYANVVETSETDEASYLRFSSYGSEYTDSSYGDYVKTGDILNYEGLMYSESLLGGDTGRRALSYAKSAGSLLNYSVASTTTQIIVTNVQDYAVGDITNNINVAISNYVNNVINNTITNFVDIIITNSLDGISTVDNTIISNIYSVLVESLKPIDDWNPSLYSVVSTGLQGLRVDLDGVGSSLGTQLQQINNKVGTIVSYLNYNMSLALTNLVNDVGDIYNLQEDMADFMNRWDTYFPAYDYHLATISDNLLQALGILSNIANASNNTSVVVDKVSVTNNVSSVLDSLFRKYFWIDNWRTVPQSSSIYWNWQNFTNESFYGKYTSLPKTLYNTYSSRIQSFYNVANTVKVTNPLSEWWQGGDLTDFIGGLDNFPAEDFLPLMNYINDNWLLYYTWLYGDITSNQFIQANTSLESISNDTQLIIGLISNLNFSASNDIGEVYADYTGVYNRVVHDLFEGLTNNATILHEHGFDNAFEVYTNMVNDGENFYNWFERVEYLLYIIAGGGGATNGFEHLETNQQELDAITNNVQSSLKETLERFSVSLRVKEGITNDISSALRSWADLIESNTQLTDPTIEWLPASVQDYGMDTYLVFPFESNDIASQICEFFRKIFMVIWFFSFAFLSWQICEKLAKVSWRVVQLIFSVFAKLLG